MKRNAEDASLTINDLRRRLLNRSVDWASQEAEEMDLAENREINREFKQYILAGVCGAIIALLIINLVS